MLPVVALGRHCCSLATDLENYRPLVGDELTDEIRDLARRLNGIRICHLNATSTAGGVAELLTRYLPLLRALGIKAGLASYPWRAQVPKIYGVTIYCRGCCVMNCASLPEYCKSNAGDDGPTTERAEMANKEYCLESTNR